MKKGLALLGALSALVVWGCTEDDGALRCLPGAVSACPCVGGGEGVQTCLPSGLGLGACECGGEGDVVSDTTNDTSASDADDTVDTGEHDLSEDTAGPEDGADGADGADGDEEVGETDGDGSGTPDTTATCPTAVIRVAQGDEVLPQTRLELDGGDSIGSVNGEVTAWKWSVIQPSGSVSTFMPSPFVRNPSFETNVVGTYTFRLEVFDADGTRSCNIAEYTVTVTSDDAIRVELLWRTPGDPDESDTGGTASFSAGSDVNLHFLHPSANGAYFDWTYDCYWENTNPEWGFFGPSDNPRLDRDDTDGAGPENLNVATPQQGMRFQVGTHYWNDWGYGDAFATIRVYIYGVLRDQWADVRITNGDMWDSHYIDWPSGTVTRITGEGGAPRITPDYPVDPGFPF
ncbi:MAG TPA: hypothetical protein PK095_03730 [Myxococcota bacterium]|nr:hypothetical protein [Myxococcota bacterium]